ncbi:MAG: hypothetical protein ACREC5_06330, partial [Thermoplasmata archaeon]
PTHSGKGSGGSRLLYEAAYPERLYRWEQARFAWEARLGQLRDRLSPEVLRSLATAMDEFHDRVATPLLLGDAAHGPVSPEGDRAPEKPKRALLPSRWTGRSRPPGSPKSEPR